MPPKSAKFEVPLPTEIKGKTISEGTWKIYRGFLNRLAPDGILTQSDLLSRQDDVIEIVKKSESKKEKQRLFMSAIVWVLTDHPESDKTKLRAFQQKTYDFPTPGTIVNGKPWLSYEDYKKQQQAPLAGAGFSFVS